MKIFALLLLATGCLAQSTPVVALSPFDVQHVKATHEAMLQAEKEWEALQGELRDRYLIVDKGDPEAGERQWHPPDGYLTHGYICSSSILSITGPGCPTKAERTECEKKRDAEAKENDAKSRRYRKGWDVLDFEYSTDWKYIVPKQKTPSISISGSSIIPWGTIAPLTVQ